MGNERHPSWTGQTDNTEHAGGGWAGVGGALASRRDSHTGTKELVYVDKTHTELPSFRSAPHGCICVQRDYDLWLEEGATEERNNTHGEETGVVSGASLACHITGRLRGNLWGQTHSPEGRLPTGEAKNDQCWLMNKKQLSQTLNVPTIRHERYGGYS